ncbi:DUF2225 domain-containing protein [Cohnella pontilimi]|uniref:DUF2225 domain-containing protein n=1 Tax=Cohnella pontilimi TaxID=2564100 RepID=A0A4U0F623_9BACL|nr:DUF2225 domain-containing protein [Cohnella pontilimi]
MDPLFQIKVTCACCEETFQTSRVRPSFKKAVHRDSDFCSHYNSVNPDFYVVRVCPHCGFASTEHFTEKLSAKQRLAYDKKVGNRIITRAFAGERTQSDAMECYKLALLCGQAIDEKDRVIAGLLHHIAWLYRYMGNKEQEKRFLAFAVEAYIRVFETERDSLSNARLMYLIGELHRRLKQYQEAVRWFGRVIQDKNITDASMIRASREMWQSIREEIMNEGLEMPEEMKETGA